MKLNKRKIKETMHKARLIIKQSNSALIREKDTASVKDVLHNMVDIVQLWNTAVTECNELLPLPQNLSEFEESSSNNKENNKQKSSKKNDFSILGQSHNDLSWMDQSVAMFIYLHPQIYGMGSTVERAVYVAKIIGVSKNTVRQWCSLSDKGAERYIKYGTQF